MPFSLQNVPGFADVPDSALAAEKPALGVLIDRMSENAAFGMVRLEVFRGLYHDGDTVSLPVSTADGYNYSRSECLYAWGISSSVNPSSGWFSGPDCLWWCAWLVDQTNGSVSCVEWYRRSGDHDQA